MIKIILVISFLFSLVHLAEAKCNFNCSAKVKLENPELIIKEGKIPLFKNHSLKPTKKNIILTDYNSYNYDYCSLKGWYLKKYPSNFSHINKKFKQLYTSNLQNNFNYNGNKKKSKDFDLIDDFDENMYTIHEDCLSGDTKSCKGIQKLVVNFQKSDALTQNKSPMSEKPQIYFDSVNRILKPLLLAYSTSSQVLGRHKNDNQIKEWALSAIYQNTYDPFETEATIFESYNNVREKDMIRETFTICRKQNNNNRCGSDPAQNHSLNSGYLAMMYGVLWSDDHMFHVGLDGYVKTLESVDNDGVLPTEARRGGNGLSYSGFTITILLNIYETALNQGHDLEKEYPVTQSLHKAVKYILDVVEDETKIYPYSKRDWTSWKGSPKKQYINGTTVFAWVRPYLLRFSNHPNSKRIMELHNKLATSDNIPQRQKELLNGLVRGNFKNKTFSKNFIYFNKYDEDDLKEPYIDDYNIGSIGSPLCFYNRDQK